MGSMRVRNRTASSAAGAASGADAAGAASEAGCAGRGGLFLFGLIFFGMGAVFVVLIARETWANWQTRTWPPMPCTVVESVVQTQSGDSDPYRPVVRYRLQGGVAGHVYETWKRNNPGYDDYARAQEVVDRYPAGSTTTAHVDPADPSRAVLEHASMWIGLFVFLPLIFVLIGGVLMVSAVRGGGGTEGAAKPQALSEKAGRGAGVALFALFLVIGLAVFVPVGVMPLIRLVEARSWPAVECRVISSRVREVRGDDSTTYKPEILYAYTYNGREYRSNRYSAHSWSSSKRANASGIVARHRPGTAATCYVNPARPAEALLSRDFDWLAVLLSMIPLVFVLVGAVGLKFMLRQRRGASVILPISAAAAAARGPLAPLTPARRGPITLRPKVKPWMRVIGFGIFALFWNGIISIFVHEAIEGWRDERPDMCLTVFMIPFVLVGLGAIAGVVHAFLAAFNPAPELTIEKSSLSPGDAVDFKWRFTGSVHRIHRLAITLEGREEATYRRGTDTVTDKHVFHRATVAETSRQMEIATGKARLSIPADTMHSFSSSNNKIVWELCLHGAIESWPDVKLDFALDVEPLPLTGGRA